MKAIQLARLILASSACLLIACSGEAGDDADGEATGERSIGARTPAVSGQQRAQAARATAESETNACAPVRPFYWEIGGPSGRLTSSSVSGPTSTVTYDATSRMDLASASKWLYAAYVAQRRAGALTSMDLEMLRLQSGYHNLGKCYPSQTVNGCLYYEDNELYDASADGKFYYDGAHLQKHAGNIGLGPLTRQALATEIKSQIAPESGLTYDVAMPPGGATANAATYAGFLRRLMSGELALGALLGTSAVCTNPADCPDEAIKTVTPPNESWHYSLGHWVEDDPLLGDGSFSSPGTKGFYPWINAGKSIYGILARQVETADWIASVQCGRLIRKAWQTGTAQE